MKIPPPVVIFVSSPYSDKPINHILGYSAYSHKILAEKILNFLKADFEAEYVANSTDLESKIIERSGIEETYLFLYIGPPENSWVSTLCYNVIIFTWEFPELPDGNISSPELNWVPNLEKFDVVVLPNTLLQKKLGELGISSIHLPVGRCVPKNHRYNLTESYEILANAGGIKFENFYANTSISAPYQNRIKLTASNILKILSRNYFESNLSRITPVFVYRFLRIAYRKIATCVNLQAETHYELFTSIENLSLEIYGKVVVSSWLNISDQRKNFDMLLKSYYQVGKKQKKAVLILKIIGDNHELNKAIDVIEKLNRKMSNSMPPIILMAGPLDEIVLAALREITDIYINTSSTEGICLPALEHALTGSEVIVPSNSAFLDYFSSETANFYGVDVVPTHFPSDVNEIISTTWSPPIFRELVDTFEKAIEKPPSMTRKNLLSERQEILRITPKQFVKEVLEK